MADLGGSRVSLALAWGTANDRRLAMETHGSESYYVIGEGLLSESIGGRDVSDGTAGIAGVTATAAAAPALPLLADGAERVRQADQRGRRPKVGREMAAGGGGSGPVPAGFTYLGQFIDHDLTFDKTTVMLGPERVAGADAPGALAEPRPGLALRSGPGRSRVGQVLHGRPPSEDGQDGGGRRLPREERLRPAARPGQHRRRRSARRSFPTRATTRTSRSRRRTWR